MTRQQKIALAVGTVFSVLMGVLTAYKTNFLSGWGDEFCYVECALNYVVNGDYVGYTYPRSGGLPYTWLLIPWLKLFGVSRMAAAGFNVFWATLTSVFIIGVAIREKVFEGIGSVTLFCFFYWSGANFAWSMTCGRLDMMVMFLTTTSAYLLLRRAKCESRNLWLLGVSVGLLTLTYFSSLPVLCALGFLILLVPTGDLKRKDIFIRGIVCAVAVILGMIVKFTRAYLHAHLIRALYVNFLSHSSAVSGTLEGSATGFCDSYLIDIPALLALFLAIAFCLRSSVRRSINWWFVLFIALIPGIMVAAGHYAFYYHWLFYVPVGVFVSAAFRHVPFRGVRVFVMLFALVYFCSFHINWFVQNGNPLFKQDQQHFHDFMDLYGKTVKRGDHIVVSDDRFFYPGIRRGYRTWVRSKDGLYLCFDNTKEKIDRALHFYFKNEAMRQKVKNLINRIENLETRSLPSSGYLFTHDERSQCILDETLSSLGFKIRVIASEGEYRLCEIKKK